MRGVRRLWLGLLCLSGAAHGVDLNVPAGHPRLWFSDATLLQQARDWHQQNPTSPDGDDFLGLAFRGLMTESSSDCQAAVAGAMAIEIDTTQISSDSARWYGEIALLVHDWCHAAFTPAQHSEFMLNWNAWQQALNAKPWGGPRMEANNYYWGYLRNGLEWGISSLGENPAAQGFIDHALGERFLHGMLREWAPSFGRGGVPGEGTQYGRYMLGYGVVPLASAADFGQPTVALTPFYRANAWQMIYATLPQTTPGPPGSGCNAAYWYLFPFNDDEQFFVCFPETARGSAYGDLMAAYLRQWPGTTLAARVRHWLDRVQPEIDPWIAALMPAQAPLNFAGLPLDYHAPGSGFVYLRNGWGEADTAINLQLGVSGNVGHNHLDAGSFQLWQNGRWLSRETVSYTEQIADWGGGPPGTVDALEAVGHNTVLLQGRGQKFWSPVREDQFIYPNPPDPHHDEGADGLPRVTRLQRSDALFFASTDLSRIYRARWNRDPCRYDWPYADSVVRDFLYLRDLNALVILDRLRASSDSLSYADGSACTFTPFDPANPALSAAQVSKTFVLHALSQPQALAGNQWRIERGNERLMLTTLVPSQPVSRVLNEGSAVGQFRLEVEHSGAAESYFLHVLQMASQSDAMLQPQVQETAQAFTVTLDASHQVTFEKGMLSSGGSVNTPQGLIALQECVQSIGTTLDGVHWGVPGCVLFKHGFEDAGVAHE